MRSARAWVSAANDAFLALAATRFRYRHVALLRASLSAIAVLMYAANYRDRGILLGPKGVVAAGDYASHGVGLLRTFSLITLEPFRGSSVWFELIYHAAIVVAVLNVFVGGRALTALHAVLFLSVVNANPWFANGGEALVRLLLPMLIVADTRGAFTLRSHKASPDNPAATVAHNVAIFLIVYQVASVYANAALWKLAGTLWQNGTAMGFILQHPEYNRFPVPGWIVHNGFAVLALSYAAILVQLAVVPVLIFGRGRRIVLVALSLMHLGIAFQMGIVEFGLIMIACDIAVLAPDRRDVPAVEPVAALPPAAASAPGRPLLVGVNRAS